MTVLRGVEQHQEQDPRLLLRDTRTLGQRISDFISDPLGVTVALVLLAFASFFCACASRYLNYIRCYFIYIKA